MPLLHTDSSCNILILSYCDGGYYEVTRFITQVLHGLSRVQTHCRDQVSRRNFMWFLTVSRRDIPDTVSNYFVAASTYANSDLFVTVHCLSKQSDRPILVKEKVVNE